MRGTAILNLRLRGKNWSQNIYRWVQNDAPPYRRRDCGRVHDAGRLLGAVRVSALVHDPARGQLAEVSPVTLFQFLEDLIRQKWGDLLGLFLVITGIFLTMHDGSPDVIRMGILITGTGLNMIRPKMLTPRQNGNGASQPDQPTDVQK
jgi:hypothetical protein